MDLHDLPKIEKAKYVGALLGLKEKSQFENMLCVYCLGHECTVDSF